MLKSKIHAAVVTEANLKYMGSITIDEDLMDAADILENEQGNVVNNNNGARLITYVINGSAARLAQPEDVVIIMSYALMEQQEAKAHVPTVVLMGENNSIAKIHAGEHERQLS